MGDFCCFWSCHLSFSVIEIGGTYVIDEFCVLLVLMRKLSSILFIFLYHTNKTFTWKELTYFPTNTTGLWCLLGDLSDIIHAYEEMGDIPFELEQENQLIQFMNEIGDVNLCSIGTKFTWCNRHDKEDRLDWVILNTRWLEFFAKALICSLPNFTSDHNPILLHIHGTNEPFGCRHVRFFEVWLRDSTCEHLFAKNWNTFSS